LDGETLNHNSNMTNVKFNKIEPQTVEVWNADGFFGMANEYEFNDIRIQIKENKDPNFYIMFRGTSYQINTDGRLEWPNGLFDMIIDQLRKL